MDELDRRIISLLQMDGRASSGGQRQDRPGGWGQ